MWDACCSLVSAPSAWASIAAAAIGLCLLTKAFDDWQWQRVRQKNREMHSPREDGRADALLPGGDRPADQSRTRWLFTPRRQVAKGEG
jgi:hypothetical protein